MIASFLNPLLSLAFPSSCRVCGRSVESFEFGSACAGCWNEVRLFTGQEAACGKCGQVLNGSSAEQDVRCALCVQHYYDRVVTAADYSGAAKAEVLSLKEVPFISIRMRGLLASAFDRALLWDHDLIAPVPLSARRAVERGFNQAEVVSRLLSGHSGIRTSTGSLQRKSHFRMHRGGMDRRSREQSVEDTFEVSKPKLVREAKVILVDDVYTTGATASACARALKGAGAAAVTVFAIARAPFVY